MRLDIGNDILYYPNGSYRLTLMDLDYVDELSQKLLDHFDSVTRQDAGTPEEEPERA